MTKSLIIKIKDFGLVDYKTTLNAMRIFTNHRDEYTIDEFWLLEHYPVFTQGQSGKNCNILKKTNIPIVQSNRGGQVTYHGPGQLVIYVLSNLRRKKISVKKLVSMLEKAMLKFLECHGIQAHQRNYAHGLYVNEAKIAQLGLRIHRGCSYHGLSFNVDMDLSPFSWINPCGFKNLPVIDLKSLGVTIPMQLVKQRLCYQLCKQMCYNTGVMHVNHEIMITKDTKLGCL